MKIVKFLILLLIFVLSNSVFAEQFDFLIPFENDNYLLQFQKNDCSETPILFNLNNNLIDELIAKQPTTFCFEIKISKNELWKVNLKKYEIFSPNAKILINNKQNEEFDFRENIVNYRGFIENNPNLKVNITFSHNLISGIITDFKDNWIIGNYRQNPTIAVIYNDKKVINPPELICGNSDSDISQLAHQIMIESSFKEKKSDKLLNDIPLEIELAVETDFQTYEFFNKDKNAEIAYITSLLSQTSMVYEKDINAFFSIKHINIWTNSEDPYSDDANDSRILLNELQEYWEENIQDVERDAVVFLTTRKGNLGGISYTIGGICLEKNSYTFANINGTFKNLPSYSYDVFVIAHELGHLCGSAHTHSCLWPLGAIDSCTGAESGFCFTEIRPAIGTIMSYCNFSEAGKILEFHPLCKNVIRAFLERSQCVGNPKDVEKIFTLSGKIYNNGNPLPNITLTIEPLNIDIWRGSVLPGGNTTSTTDSTGYYSFNLLSTGYYNLKLPEGYTFLPFSDLAEAGAVIIPNENTQKDFNIDKTFKLSGKTTFNQLPKADSIKYLFVKIDSSKSYPIFSISSKTENYSFKSIQGQYIILPLAKNYKFYPPYQKLSITNSNIDSINFKSEYSNEAMFWGYVQFRKIFFYYQPFTSA
nr:M12 family metallo-peptidase [Candidatus Kapabacteria bacterium]